jgi:2-oxoisovalerate dehydrogenase E2 component (dihydrolipoyl transacylase)
MSTYTFKLPDLGEGTVESEIVEWRVQPGDRVQAEQPLVDMMTDKATVEITSPVSGRVVSLAGQPGDVIAVGRELVVFETGDGFDRSPEADPAPAAAAADSAGPRQPSALTPDASADPAGPRPPPANDDPLPVTLDGGPVRKPAPDAVSATTASVPQLAAPTTRKPLTSPAVRRRAREAGVDLRGIPGTGTDGRIRQSDLEKFLSGVQPAAAGPARARRTDTEEIKVIGLRRRIAERMAESKRRIPHFGYVEEIDVTELESLRRHLNEKHGAGRPKLTVLPFCMQALVRVLADFPQCNAHYDDEAQVVTRFGGVHIGIAAQTDGGLMVPVVRHVESLDLWQCAAEMQRLTAAARDGKATKQELTGSTITITSLGALGGIATMPVINHPEVAIIGVNKMELRPVIRDGQIVPRLMMNLSSAFDHRVVDGYDAARMIQALKALLEHPATIYL